MKRWLVVIIPAVILGGLIAVRVKAKKAEAAEQDKVRAMRMKTPPVVSVASVGYRDIIETYESVATAESPYNVKISPKVTGRIDFLQVREGDRVNAGDVLVRLDPADVEGQVQQARAAVAEAQSRLAQASLTLGPTETNISTNIRQQQAAVEVAKSDLNLVLTNSEFKKANQRTFITDATSRVKNAEAAIAKEEASVKAAKANLENAKSKMNRVNDLYKQGFIAAQDVDDARTQVSVMEGALDVAQGELNSAKANRD
jgi:HlyD family secretion protein